MPWLKPRYRYRRLWKRLAAFGLDLFGGILFGLIRRLRPCSRPQNPERILVVRIDQIGDVVMIRPALSALHRRYPHARIDLLLTSETLPLFRDTYPWGDVLACERSWFKRGQGGWRLFREYFRLVKLLRSRQYDIGIDFRGDLRTIRLLRCAKIPWRIGYANTGGGFWLSEALWDNGRTHQVTLNLLLTQRLGADTCSELESFTYTAARRGEIEKELGFYLHSDSRPRVIIHGEAGYPSKRWPWTRYEELIRMLLDRREAHVILIGQGGAGSEGRALPAHPDLRDLRGKTRLEDLPVIMDLCDLYVGNDSGPAHLAAAQKLESIILFSGTNDENVWHPWNPKLHLIRYAVPCSPCESPRCRYAHHDCLMKISVREVHDCIRLVLAQRTEKPPR
ncbi:MAG: glycosyltransferase family 9 protein [Candidatus Omnitrophota bacterium]